MKFARTSLSWPLSSPSNLSTSGREPELSDERTDRRLALVGVGLALVGIALAPLGFALGINWDDRVEIALYTFFGLLVALGVVVATWPMAKRLRLRTPVFLRPTKPPDADELRQLWESSAQDAYVAGTSLLKRLADELRDTRQPGKWELGVLVNHTLDYYIERNRAAFTNPFVERNEATTRGPQEAFGDFYYHSYLTVHGWIHILGRLTALSAEDRVYQNWAKRHRRFMEELDKLARSPGFETLKQAVKGPGEPDEPGAEALKPRSYYP